MKRLLITGICGFVGSVLAKEVQRRFQPIEVVGIDYFSRSGSEGNLPGLREAGIDARLGDIRRAADLEQFGGVDWVIDAAANPSVLAGIDGRTSSSELIDQNLFGTVPILEYCRRYQATFTLLSTSRVYSIEAMRAIPLKVNDRAYHYAGLEPLPHVSEEGITEAFPTTPPVSLYGVSKLCSEKLALEYGSLFGFPVWINRCGVMAGAGQFGQPEQGIFSFWLRAWAAGKTLRYLGFGGSGYQVRDCLNPKDLVSLLWSQFSCPLRTTQPRIVNVSGGAESAISLAQLSDFCREHIGPCQPVADGSERPFDIPWLVLDSSLARRTWGWRPQYSLMDTLHEIKDAIQP